MIVREAKSGPIPRRSIPLHVRAPELHACSRLRFEKEDCSHPSLSPVNIRESQNLSHEKPSYHVRLRSVAIQQDHYCLSADAREYSCALSLDQVMLNYSRSRSSYNFYAY